MSREEFVELLRLRILELDEHITYRIEIGKADDSVTHLMKKTKELNQRLLMIWEDYH